MTGTTKEPSVKPLRVCHVTVSLELGGAERVAVTLMEGLSPRGVTSCVFCTDAEGPLFASAHAAARLCARRRVLPWVIDWKVVRQLVHFARSNAVTLFHAHNTLPHIYTVMAGVFTHVPIVLTLHGQAFYDSVRLRPFRRLLCRRTQAVVAVSGNVGDHIRRAGVVPESKIVVIRNGIDISRFDLGAPGTRFAGVNPPPMCLSGTPFPAGSFVVGSVGRLSCEKNYALLLRAFAVARQQAPDCRLILVGDGPERAGLEEECRRLGLEGSVAMPGMQADVVQWLRMMDVFCLSSDTEGTSISLLEAGACSLPAVVTDVGGNAEVVPHGKTGIVVPRGDESAISQALLKLHSDRAAARTMGEEARRRVVGEYSAAAMLGAYERLYRSVVRGGK